MRKIASFPCESSSGFSSSQTTLLFPLLSSFPSRGNQTASMSVPVPCHILGSKYTSTLSAPYRYAGFLRLPPSFSLPTPLPSPPRTRPASQSSERFSFLVPKIMNWSKTIMRVRNVSPIIPTTRMIAESKTGNWSIHGLGPYLYELSAVETGGRERFGKWVSLSLRITAPAKLE